MIQYSVTVTILTDVILIQSWGEKRPPKFLYALM